MPEHYILGPDGEPRPASLLEWAVWFGHADRVVARTEVVSPAAGDRVAVSTVFLGLNHGWPGDPDPRPVLWETMVFGGPHDEFMDRYRTRADAEAGHAAAVAMCQAGPSLT